MRVSREVHQRHGQAHSGQSLRDLLPWAPTLFGVVALFVLLIFAATRFTPRPAPAAMPPAPAFLPPPVLTPADLTSAPPLPPALPGQPPVDPVSTDTVARNDAPEGPEAEAGPEAGAEPETEVTATAKPRPSKSPARAATTSPAPPPSPVTGRYQVLNSYSESFIGEVLVSNSSGRDSNWQVQLRFPATVGELTTAWVEGAPQATLRRSGATYTWSSGVPVPANSQVPLRFHFSRSGSGNLPAVCTVNGGTCTGLR